MNSLPAFYFLEPEPLIKAMVKTKKVHLKLGQWQGLAIIAIGPRGGKIVGYGSDGKPIYAGSQTANHLVDILQKKHKFTPDEQDLHLVTWLQHLGLQGAVDKEKVLLSAEGAQVLQSAFGVAAEPLGGGKWGISKGHLLPHLGQPLKPSEEHQTSWAAEMASGEYQTDLLPPLHTLKEVPAGKFAGSHGNQLFEDKSGKKWVFKPADPIIARAEEAASRIGRLVLGNKVPLSRYVQVKGKDGVLIQVLDGEVWQESSGQHSDPQINYLKKFKDQVMQHEVLDWLISNHDSHAGNFLADGKEMKAIDKGQAWKWIGEDKLDPSFKGNNPSYQIYKKFWSLVQEGKISSDGLIEAAAEAVNRAEQISPEQFQLIVAPYVSTWAGWKDEDPHAQLQKMLSRLTSLRSDFEQFLSSQLKKHVVLPKPSPIQVNLEGPAAPAAPPAEKKPEKLVVSPQPVQLPTPAAVSPVALQEKEKAPVSPEPAKAGWPLTKKGPKTGVTIHDPGKVPPASWPGGMPAPGLHLTVEYKGGDYSLIVGADAATGKPSFKVIFPDGKEASFTSLNAAGDALYLHKQGLPLNLTATEKKKQGISLGSKVFQLKLFEKELGEAYGKEGEPVAVAAATPAQLEEQKVIEPEQKQASAFQLLVKTHLAGAVLSMYEPALPQEVKEFLVANTGMNQLSKDWDLAVTPGQVAVAKHDFFGGPVILAAKLSKEGKPELWGWWEDVAKGPQTGWWSGTTAKAILEATGLKDNPQLAEAKQDYQKSVDLEMKSKEPVGPPPAVELPENAVVPPEAPKYNAGPLAPGTVIKVKKKVPKYDKKQEVTLSVLQNGKLLVEIPGQTAHTFETLSAASDHVWVVQKGYADAADYKAQNKTNKVPSGGGWKFWGISPAAAPAAPSGEPGAGGAAVPAAPPAPVPAAGTPPEAAPPPAPAVAPTPDQHNLVAKLKVASISNNDTGVQSQLDAMPVGSEVHFHFGTDSEGTLIYTKVADDGWTLQHKTGVLPKPEDAVTAENASVGLIIHGTVIDKVKFPSGAEIGGATPAPAAAEPAKPSTVPEKLDAAMKTGDAGKILDVINKYAAGMTITFHHKASPQNVWTLTKVPGGEWQGALNGTPMKQTVMAGAVANTLLGGGGSGLVLEDVSAKPAEEPAKGKLPNTLSDFSELPVGTFVQTKSPWGATTTYLKENDDKWKITLESGEYHKYDDMQALGMINGEKVDAWSPGGEASAAPEAAPEKPAVPEKPEAGGENWEWFKLHPVEAAAKVKPAIKEHTGEFEKLPAGTTITYSASKGIDAPVHMAVKNANGGWDFTFASGTQTQHTDSLTQTALTLPDAVVKTVTGPKAGGKLESTSIPEKVTEADLNLYPTGTVIKAKSKTMVGTEYTYTKLANGKWQISGGGIKGMYAASDAETDLGYEEIVSLETPETTPAPAAAAAAELAEKPVEQMTPAEKTTPVKSMMPLQAALKIHPGLQEGTLKVKKAKGDAVYICLDGVDGASTKLYNALSELGVDHYIKNKGGIPKVNAKGAFVTVPGHILQHEVAVTAPALDASSAKHAPSEDNWQTMPEAAPKAKPSKADKDAAAKAVALKQKAEAIKSWGEQHPPVTDKAALQVLSHLQQTFDNYGIPVGVIARMEGDQLLLSHKTHQAQLEKLIDDLAIKVPFAYQTASTPWGAAVKLGAQQLKAGVEKATGLTIGGMIAGPDGKEYPSGTTFQKKVTEHTVQDLLKTEPGFYKIKEHNTDPANLALLKVAGTSPESVGVMKGLISKYGLESPFPEPKVGASSVVHSVFKKSLEKVHTVETSYEAAIPPQPDAFVPGSLPYVDTGALWEEVGDGSGDLASIAAIKPARFGHVMRLGAPGQLRDFAIRYRKVKDQNGKAYYEFTGDLVSFSAAKSDLSSDKVAFGSTQGDTLMSSTGNSLDAMTYDPESGEHTEAIAKMSGVSGVSGYVGKTDGGSSIAVIPPSPSQDTFKNTFRVRIPVGKDPVSELRAALQKMGKNPDLVLAPLTEESDRIFKKSMLVRGGLGARGWNEDHFSPGSMHDEGWLDGQLASLGLKSKAKNLRVVKTFDNQISVVTDDPEKFKNWAFAYVGSNVDGTFAQLLQGSGWSSRRNRLLHGVWNSGQSPGPDFQNGGAKGTFFRIAGNGSEMSSAYQCQIIAHPRVFQRTDWWRFNGDAYGNTSSHNQHGSSVSNSPKRYDPKLAGTNEVLFEGGVALQDIVAVVVDDAGNRKAMIAALKKAGKTEINGKPLEDFIIAPTHKGVNVYGDPFAVANKLGIAGE